VAIYPLSYHLRLLAQRSRETYYLAYLLLQIRICTRITDLRLYHDHYVEDLFLTMNSHTYTIHRRLSHLFLGSLALLSIPTALTAAPIDASLTVANASPVWPSTMYVNQPVLFTGAATESDGKLSRLVFNVIGPGYPNWTPVGSLPASGYGSGGSITWNPPAAGTWTVMLQSWGDNNTTSNSSLTSQFTVISTGFNFKVLIDVNQMTSQEANAIVANPSVLAADGVWGLIGNPDSINISDTTWNSVFADLGANNWLVAEADLVNYPLALPSQYQTANNVDAFNEDFVSPGYFTVASYSTPGYGSNTGYEYSYLFNTYGSTFLLHSRTYDPDPDAAPQSHKGMVDAMIGGFYSSQQAANSDNVGAFYNPYPATVAGVVFETGPVDSVPPPIQDQNFMIYHVNLPAGVQDVLGQPNKKCYILAPAFGDETNYLLAIQQMILYFQQTGELSNPKLYIVLANYDRPGPNHSQSIPNYTGHPTSSTFFLNVLTPQDTTQDTNTLAAALAWLKSIR